MYFRLICPSFQHASSPTEIGGDYGDVYASFWQGLQPISSIGEWLGSTAMSAASELAPTPDDTMMILRTPTTPLLDTATLLIADHHISQM